MSSLMKGNQLIWLLLLTYLDFATPDNKTGTSFLIKFCHFVNDMQTSMLFLLHLLHTTRNVRSILFVFYR